MMVYLEGSLQKGCLFQALDILKGRDFVQYKKG